MTSPMAIRASPASLIAATIALRARSIAAAASSWAFSMAYLTALRARSKTVWMAETIALKKLATLSAIQPKTPPPLLSLSASAFLARALPSASSRAARISSLPSSR